MAKMKVYITKHALTRGIYTAEASVIDDRRISIRGEVYNDGWHETFEAARDQAEALRAAKIKSLERSLAKLKDLSFSEPAAS